MAFHIVSSPFFLCLRKIYLDILKRNTKIKMHWKKSFANFCNFVQNWYVVYFQRNVSYYFYALRRYWYYNFEWFSFKKCLYHFPIVYTFVIKCHRINFESKCVFDISCLTLFQSYLISIKLAFFLTFITKRHSIISSRTLEILICIYSSRFKL